MPITINGSGTITGLSVGGLPDGTVDTDTLASSVALGITEADQWRFTSNTAGDQDPITSNLERNDTYFDKIGTGMSESSGVFTFPSTGIWSIRFNAGFVLASQSTQFNNIIILATTDNSNYASIGEGFTSDGYGGISGNVYLGCMANAIFDVTNVSTHKVKFKVDVHQTANNSLLGSSTKNLSDFTFIRLGAT